ncbi:MAG: ATP phosphoribosyltransferase [Bacillota bacterium]
MNDAGREDGLLTIALPKGRLFAASVGYLETIGAGSCSLGELDRSLSVVDPGARLQYLLVRPSDVVAYVAEGAADLGVVGKDVLLEDEAPVYELVDLGFGRCHMAVAAPEESSPAGDDPGALYRRLGTDLRVATKYPRFTRRHFAGRGIRARVIELRGSVELAPLVGLADVIVDVVASGRTLLANGLVEVEHLADVTARLVANPVALKVKPRVEELLGSTGRGVLGC